MSCNIILDFFYITFFTYYNYNELHDWLIEVKDPWLEETEAHGLKERGSLFIEKYFPNWTSFH